MDTAVVVIEDDQTIGRLVDRALVGNGYRSTWCATGRSGLLATRRERAEVVLLDLGLPDLDGIDVARRLRADFPDLLMIILTARGDEIDIIAGLDAGADDYLVKPFSLTVLLARLRAHLRHHRDDPRISQPVVIADLVLDGAARRCTVADAELALRPKEYELLEALMRNAGVAVSREELMAKVWDENWFGSTKTLDVTMASLRRRLQQAAAESATPVRLPVLSTLRGHGYRLDPPAETR